MPRNHPLAATTHTRELHQLQEINGRLSARSQHRITAQHVDLSGTPLSPGRTMFPGWIDSDAVPRGKLPGKAVLERIEAHGPPDFPYLLGHFTIPNSDPDAEPEPEIVMPLHSATLRRISALLGRPHVWGDA